MHGVLYSMLFLASASASGGTCLASTALSDAPVCCISAKISSEACSEIRAACRIVSTMELFKLCCILAIPAGNLTNVACVFLPMRVSII